MHGHSLLAVDHDDCRTSGDHGRDRRLRRLSRVGRRGEERQGERPGRRGARQAGAVQYGCGTAQGHLRAGLQMGRGRHGGVLDAGLRAVAEVAGGLLQAQDHAQGHRGDLHPRRRPSRADDRCAASQGRTGHPGHRAEGAEKEGRGRMRIALHTGKGGGGKTTISAATAVACAAGGARTLLVSTDPAHSIADVLGAPVHGDPTPVDGVAGLWAAQVDARGRFEQSWAHIREYLVGVLSARGMAQVQAEELTVLPGAEEIVALLELRRLAASGQFDAIVVDCAPTGETLRLLALPETIGFYAQRLLGAPQRVLRSIAASFTGMRGALGELLSELMAARALLADPAITGVRLVLTPERMVVAEARRLFTALSLHGFRVEAVNVNRLLPPHVGGEFLRLQREGQREAMTLVEESFQGLAIRRVLQKPVEPIGLPRLSEMAADMFSGLDPMASTDTPIGMEVSGSDGWYRLALPLPLAERGGIALSRSGADLVVTVGDVRRRIALPSVLQRCSTEGASFAQGRLMIDFAADPALWPASLIPAPLVGTG